jgi:cell division protein FtsA
MRDSQIVVGVDIGSAKIATVIGQAQEETINILGVAEVPSRGIRKGQIVDIEDTASALNQSLDVAERMAGSSIDRVFVSISGIHVDSQNSKGIVAISQPQGEITHTDIERVLEAAGAISIPTTRSIIHVLPKTYTVDGESGIKDPVGMNGVRLEVDTHIITANSTSVKNIQRVLETEGGVQVLSHVFSGYASALSVLTETEKELGVVIADIGAGITNICIFVDGNIAHSSVIPVGARHITNDLAIGLRISLDSAEKIKLYLSQHLSKEARKKHAEEGGEKPSDEIDISALGIPEELKKVSQKTLIDGIIRPRLNELFTLIGMEIKKSGLGTQTPAGIVITGGGARTVGAEDAAKRMLSMPVRIGIPQNITGLIDDVENPSYATPIGLFMYAQTHTGPEVGGFLSNPLGNLSMKSANDLGTKVQKLFKKFLP